MTTITGRRAFLKSASMGALLPGFTEWFLGRRSRPTGPPGRSAVVALKASSYSGDLADCLIRGIRECGMEVRGKRVLLKPNLVEFEKTAPINTNVAVVAAAVDVFERLGAAQVIIGEGPGHRRDAYYLAEEAGYRKIDKFDQRFVDLNRDDVTLVPGFVGSEDIYLPNTALTADLIVSLAKMKTHHWTGATLAMKNLFGLVPGAVYGWPKNYLHYHGIGTSIVGLNRIFRRTFAIVDGIVGMEGNGPIQGTARAANVLVMGNDLVAVDATCCRAMGIDPELVSYLELASNLGHLSQERIDQRGEELANIRTDFALMDAFRGLRLAGPGLPSPAKT